MAFLDDKAVVTFFSCGKVYESVPVDILARESPLFKSLYDESSGNAEPHRIEEEIRPPETREESSPEKTSVADEILDDSSEDEKSATKNTTLNSKTLQKMLKLKPEDVQISRSQFDVIDVSNFRPESVKILCDFLRGYPLMMQNCSDFGLLHDMLCLCTAYNFQGPIPAILNRIDKSCITMSKLMDVLEISENLKDYEDFQEVSEDLYRRCVAYCRSNFASWQIIVNLLTKKIARCDLTKRIFQSLNDDTDVTIGLRIEDIKNTETKTTQHIVKNMQWKISAFKSKVSWTDYLGVELRVENPRFSDSWTCTAQVELKLVNAANEASPILKFERKFCEEYLTKRCHKFLSWDNVMALCNGSNQGSSMVVEAKIHIKDCKGVGAEIEEQKIGWFSQDPLVTAVTDVRHPNQGMPEKVADDTYLLLVCDNKIEGISKSILMEESLYFKSRLSEEWDFSGSHEQQFSSELIKIQSNNIEAFQTVLIYLKGYHEILEARNSFIVLGEMLRICDYYQITKLSNPLTKKIQELPITVSNLMEAFRSSQNLINVPGCQKVGRFLQERSIIFAMVNFTSWQNLISFLAGSNYPMESLVEILECLLEEQDFDLRCKFSITESPSQFSLNFIKQNLEWKIEVKKEKYDDEECLQCFLHCQGFQQYLDGWKCLTEGLNMEVYNYCDGTWSNDGAQEDADVDIDILNEDTSSAIGYFRIKYWDEVMDPNEGYIKDGRIEIKLSFKVVEVEGIPECLGVQEQMIR